MTQRFYEGMKAVYGPQAQDITPTRTEDGSSLITGCKQTLRRWAEYVNAVVNRPSAFSEDALDDIPHIASGNEFADTPITLEKTTTIKQMSKHPGADRLPAQIYKQLWWLSSK